MSSKVKISILVVLLAGAALWYFIFRQKVAAARLKKLDFIFNDSALVRFTQYNLPPPPSDPKFDNWAVLWIATVNNALPEITADRIDAIMVSNFINSPAGLGFRNNNFAEPCYLTVRGNSKPAYWATKDGKKCGPEFKLDFYMDASTLAKYIFG